MTSPTIQAHFSQSGISRKRRSELFLALTAFLLIALFSWIELKFFGVNSYFFLAIFNLNVILLLIILFLVLRNGVKLFLERKRKVPGSGLRAKLVIAFISLSLIPTILMFLMAIKFVQASVDYWFKSKVDSSMEQALDVGTTFYAMKQDELNDQGRFIIEQVRTKEFLWGAAGMDKYLNQKAGEYGLSLVGVVAPNLKEQNWHASEEWEESWPQIKETVDWVGMKDQPRYWSSMLTSPEKDLVVGIVPVDEAKTGFLVLGSTVGHGLLTKLEQIVQGVKEYKQLKALKRPLKVAFYVLLGVMTLLIVFGAMWFGFRLAKEISAPIQALSLGTQRIAHGDLGVRLEDQAVDELGHLVQSFNVMAEDLEKSQQRLNKANEDLGLQNIELEQRRKYMEAVLNTVTSGVISLDSQDRISTVNKAAEEILGAEGDKLIGKNPVDLLKGEHATMLSDALKRLKFAPNTQWQRQIDVTLGSGQRKLLVNAVGLKASHGEDIGMVLVFEDVTELDKMQRMTAWREVAKRIAHEIKNPLTPIKLSAQRLERKYGAQAGDETFVECTRVIVRQVEHLQQMVKEFSSFAKLPEIVMEENELPSLLEEVVALFRNSHTQISWELDLNGDLPVVTCDRGAMKRVFINLLTNASEVLENEIEPRVVVSARHLADSSMVRIRVSDNGPGFESEEPNRLFEPYFSKKKGNTGLGLTIVKSIVSDHQGQLQVQPNTPKGTTFVVDLPV
jgi:two-component system nitrogen regulation sensor histidine kinase NtrY